MFSKPSRILICASGSRGDCQPYCALGLGLKQNGCEVKLFTNPEHRGLVINCGIEFESNGIDFKSAFLGDACNRAFQKNNFFAFLDVIGKLNSENLKQSTERMLSVINEYKPDLCVFGTSHALDVIWVPVATGIPATSIVLQRDCIVDVSKAPFGLPSLPCSLNRPIWSFIYSKYTRDVYSSLGDVFLDAHMGPEKKKLFPTGADMMDLFSMLPGYPQQFRKFIYVAIAMDERTIGGRREGVDPPWATYTGPLIVPQEKCIGSEFGNTSLHAMHKFLDSGQPPVYIGWGSVKCGSSKQMFLLAVRALYLAQQRGVVLGGWANLGLDAIAGETDENVLREFCDHNLLVMETAPHEVLFPQCSVIVHHGGIGTTNASLRCGRPTVITPILFDQFDSAKMVNTEKIGIGGPHFASISPSMLASYIKRCISDVEVKKNAKAHSAKLCSRDGVADNLEFIGTVLGTVHDGTYMAQLHEWMATKLKQCT